MQQFSNFLIPAQLHPHFTSVSVNDKSFVSGFFIMENTTLLPSYEIWKWIPGYEGRFEVSNRGRVRKWRITKGGIQYLINPIFISSIPNNRGYIRLPIGEKKNNDKKSIGVHALVAQSFCYGFEKGKEPDHINGVKHCNEWWNLEWVSHYDNLNRAFATGLVTLVLGEKQGKAKLKNNQVLDIYNSKKLKTDLAKIYNVGLDCIWGIQCGRTWSHLTGAARHFKPSERGKYKLQSYHTI